MPTSSYIKDLENQYFQLELLIMNNQANDQQQIRFREIKEELLNLPNNVVSDKISQEKKVINKRKFKF